MKVLIVYPDFATSYRNGIASVVNYLPESLKKNNCEVRTIQFTKKASTEADPRNNILVHANKVDLSSLYDLASKVKKEAEEGNYDIVHGQGASSVLFKSLGSSAPACVTNHGIGFKCFHFYWKFKELNDPQDLLQYLKYFPQKIFDIIGGSLLYSKADRVIAVSNFIKQEISKIYHVREEKIDEIPNGVSTDLFTPNVPKSEKNKIKESYNFEKALLTLPPVPRKGTHLLIKALPAVIKEIPNLKLLIVGAIPTSDTYYKFCYELSKKLQVEERVSFVGWVDDVDLPKYYSVASAYVLPSLYEPFGITVLESMACGTPVCASRSGGLPEIVTDGEDGFLFDSKDTASLAENLIALLSNDALQRRMSFNARKKIENQFSWDNIAARYIKSYEKTIQNASLRL
jgi:glycosyltransferase involved in cell wall biosynthesis